MAHASWGHSAFGLPLPPSAVALILGTSNGGRDRLPVMSRRQDGPITRSGVLEESPARQRRKRKGRVRQEDVWAARSGPVQVRYVCICPRPDCRAH